MNNPHPNQLSTDTATSGAQGSGAFTPGPWKHSGEGAGPLERDPRVWIYAPDAIGNHPRIATVEAVMRDGDQCAINLANARLIAAAPAMYEALKDLLSAVEAQAQHAARVNTHSDAHLWEPSELLMKPARDALAAVDGRA
jgi:hypothetical protein